MRLLKSPFVRYGVPFGTILLGGVYAIARFQMIKFERKDRHTQMKDERGEEEMDMEQEVRKLHAKLQLADYKMKPIARTEAQLEADRVRYLEKKEARRRDV